MRVEEKKAVPLQSDLTGIVLESPQDECVNSGVFGRAQRFVNHWFKGGESPPKAYR